MHIWICIGDEKMQKKEIVKELLSSVERIANQTNGNFAVEYKGFKVTFEKVKKNVFSR